VAEVTEIVCTDAQTQVIIRNRYKYIWRITYADGTVLDQISPTGEESKIDFLRPMSEIAWLPTMPGLKSASIQLRPGQHPILLRRTFCLLQGGSTFIASYLIGVEQLQPDQTLGRSVCFLSPPAEGLVIEVTTKDGAVIPTQRIVKFDGAIEQTSDHINFQSAAEKWYAEVKPVVAA